MRYKHLARMTWSAQHFRFSNIGFSAWVDCDVTWILPRDLPKVVYQPFIIQSST